MADKIDCDELISISNHLFVETSLFTKGLGLTVETMARDNASMKFTNGDDLTGSERTQNLHGGVIASVMDITGSLAVFSNLVFKSKKQTLQEKIKRITRINTIDLRIDYLRPAAGNFFVATGYLLRTGRKVAVARMELHNEEDKLVAVGTGSYIIGLASE